MSRTRPPLSLMLILLLIAGCGDSVRSTAAYPTPVPSAAQPAASGRGDLDLARSGAERLRAALRDMEPKAALERIAREGLRIPDGSLAAACVGVDGQAEILLCHFGPDLKRPIAQAILWYGHGDWQVQLYPQGPPKVADERQRAFARLNCQIGCGSTISQVRQAPGPNGDIDLLVVVDLGGAAGVPAEEVQLLRLHDGHWEVVWLPPPGTWNYGHARVKLPSAGISSFQVDSSSWLREDLLTGYLAEPESAAHRRFQERWTQVGQSYLLRDRLEEPSPMGALVRLVHYLSTGADEKAAALLAPGVELELARKALAQEPPRQGWAITKSSETSYVLTKTESDKAPVTVRLAKEGDEWRIAELRP